MKRKIWQASSVPAAGISEIQPAEKVRDFVSSFFTLGPGQWREFVAASLGSVFFVEGFVVEELIVQKPYRAKVVMGKAAVPLQSELTPYTSVR